MPEKFRSRVVFLPERICSQKIYKIHKARIKKLEDEWIKSKELFGKQLEKFFPNLKETDIIISPTLYGSIGFVKVENKQIIVCPRYDRDIVGLHKLLIRGLVSFNFPDLSWQERQLKSSSIQSSIYPNMKSLVDILDTQFAGRLAQESAIYLERLKIKSNRLVIKPKNLTKNENILFNLLLRNKNKLVSYDSISDQIWGDKSYEKYSEYAITKLTERLKSKLPKYMIHSQRGVGYVLHI